METTTYEVTRVTTTAARPFEQVTAAVEALAGRTDLAAVERLLASAGSADRAREGIEALAGSSGLMIFAQFDHGRLLGLAGLPRKARLYVLGNPLVAVQMTVHATAVSLYAPWRLLVYEDDAGTTRLTYERPPSVLGQFRDERILEVARALDQKLETLVRTAAGVADPAGPG
jgi:uncharacterized protein (DUF302 family)